MSLVLFIVGLFLFIGLIVVHEFGHFIVARRNGVDVEEFAIFFPPRLFKRRTRAGWDFAINLLPLGGYVRLKGEHDSDTAPGTFGAASLWIKSKIMAAGVVMNLLVALALFTVLALTGLPKIIDNQFSVKSDAKVVSSKVVVGFIDHGSPADKAGLKPADQLISLAAPGHKPAQIKTAGDLPKVTKQFAGQPVIIRYVRAGQARSTQAKLLSTSTVRASETSHNQALKKTQQDCADVPPVKGYLGIAPVEYSLSRSTWSAPVTAVGFSGQVTALTYQGIGRAFAGLGRFFAGFVTHNTLARQNGGCAASSQVAGPVELFMILKSGSLLGLQYVLLIIAVISLTLAIINILPVPALDGGRLWLTLIFHALRRPLSATAEETINFIGMLVLFGLIILITIVDVKRF